MAFIQVKPQPLPGKLPSVSGPVPGDWWKVQTPGINSQSEAQKALKKKIEELQKPSPTIKGTPNSGKTVAQSVLEMAAASGLLGIPLQVYEMTRPKGQETASDGNSPMSIPGIGGLVPSADSMKPGLQAAAVWLVVIGLVAVAVYFAKPGISLKI